MLKLPEIINLEQGSPEWHALRKTKITATDASIILGINSWKTPLQLYNEKISDEISSFTNERMQRGIELEPIARDLFILKTGIVVEPSVIVKDWVMASLDGISACGKYIVEIKCPNENDHLIAINKKIPDHYYPQIQHQIYVSNVEFAYYFSFDGFDGVVVKVERNNEYIEKMIEEEKKFYDCLINRIPPPSTEKDYIERSDDLWNRCALKWKLVTSSLKELEKQEEMLRQELILLSGKSNSKGAGISLCQVQRKGNIDYSKIPELMGMNLEKYRKPSINSWRISEI